MYMHAGSIKQHAKMLRFFIFFFLFIHSCVAAPKIPAAVPATKWLTLNGMLSFS